MAGEEPAHTAVARLVDRLSYSGHEHEANTNAERAHRPNLFRCHHLYAYQEQVRGSLQVVLEEDAKRKGTMKLC